MTTPKQKIGLSAAEWKARYAEIAPQYVGGNMQPARRILLPAQRERVRQWEQFTYALERPRNVKVPADPKAAHQALVAFIAGKGDQS